MSPRLSTPACRGRHPTPPSCRARMPNRSTGVRHLPRNVGRQALADPLASPPGELTIANDACDRPQTPERLCSLPESPRRRVRAKSPIRRGRRPSRWVTGAHQLRRGQAPALQPPEAVAYGCAGCRRRGGLANCWRRTLARLQSVRGLEHPARPGQVCCVAREGVRTPHRVGRVPRVCGPRPTAGTRRTPKRPRHLRAAGEEAESLQSTGSLSIGSAPRRTQMRGGDVYASQNGLCRPAASKY
jgi:hypothetical protein